MQFALVYSLLVLTRDTQLGTDWYCISNAMYAYILLHFFPQYVTKTDKDDVLYGAHIYALLFGALGMLQLILTFFSVSCTLVFQLYINEFIYSYSYRLIIRVQFYLKFPSLTINLHFSYTCNRPKPHKFLVIVNYYSCRLDLID